MSRTNAVLDAVAAVSSITCKPGNQDACRACFNEARGITGVVVADGIGSHHGADVAASFAAGLVADSLESLTADAPIDMIALYAEVNRALTAFVTDLPDLPPELDWHQAFGTTLLCAVDAGDTLTVAYLGNGSVFHVRGDFNTFPRTQLLPWSAVNLLSPHALSVNGRNRLYKFLGPHASGPQITPTVLTISKDAALFGDIVVLCTDGIASQDQTPVGTDDQNQIWIRGDVGVPMLYEHLSTYFQKASYCGAALTAALDRYLIALAEHRLVSDDCTVGVLVSASAARYQASRRVTEPEGAPA